MTDWDMTDWDVWGPVACLFFVALTTFFIGLAIGGEIGARHEKRIAVKAGVGRLVSDPKTGEVIFLYGARKQ